MKGDTIKTAGVVIIKDDSVLLVCHKQAAGHLTGTYGLPAGRIETGETAEEAAVRELQEETGFITTKSDLTCLPKTYTAEIERKSGRKTFSLEAFVCSNYSGSLVSSDEQEPEWIKLSELDTINLLPSVKEVVTDSLNFSINVDK